MTAYYRGYRQAVLDIREAMRHSSRGRPVQYCSESMLEWADEVLESWRDGDEEPPQFDVEGAMVAALSQRKAKVKLGSRRRKTTRAKVPEGVDGSILHDILGGKS